jgi:hypothetical protein
MAEEMQPKAKKDSGGDDGRLHVKMDDSRPSAG